MTIIGLVSLLVLASADPEPDPAARLEQLQKKVDQFERWQRIAEERRESAIRTYRTALAAHRAAKVAYDTLPLPRSEAESMKLREASDSFVKAALAAYAEAPKMRDEILLQLAVTVSNGQKAIPLIEAMKSGVLTGKESPKEISEFVQLAGEKIEFARMLARPENRGALRSLLQELRDRYHLRVDPDDAQKYDFRNVFEVLRDLDAIAYKETARKTVASMGVHDPERKYVSERLSVVYLTDRGVASEVLDGFKAAFSGWMRTASPDRAIKELSYDGWNADDVKKLMDEANAILASESPAAMMPACPADESSPASQRQRALCGPAYGGVIAIQIRTGPDGVSRAVASWRTHEEGKQLNKGDGIASEPFTLNPAKRGEAKSAEEGLLKGDRFAIRVMGTGTVYKRIKKLFEQLAALERAQHKDADRKDERTNQPIAAETSGEPKKVPEPSPASTSGSTRSSGPPGDKVPAIVETLPPPGQPGGNPWHAFFFAATPYFEDPKATWKSKTVFSAVDLLGLGTSVLLLSRSIEARNGPSGGEAGSIDDANALRKASGLMLGGLVLFRAATAGCYAWRKCRALTTW